MDHIRQDSFEENRGFSVLELLIVVAMIFVISGFAVMQIIRSQRQIERANAAQQLAAYMEKARLDSIRRRPAAPAEMAQIAIINASFYSVAIDLDGNGIVDAPRVFSLPANSSLQFNTPFPRTVYFNWRGRTVDSSGNSVSPAFITISNSYGTSRIDLSTGGQPSLDGPPTTSTVTNSTASSPNFRSRTQIP